MGLYIPTLVHTGEEEMKTTRTATKKAMPKINARQVILTVITQFVERWGRYGEDNKLEVRDLYLGSDITRVKILKHMSKTHARVVAYVTILGEDYCEVHISRGGNTTGKRVLDCVTLGDSLQKLEDGLAAHLYAHDQPKASRSVRKTILNKINREVSLFIRRRYS